MSVRVSVAAGVVLDPADRAGLASLTALLLTRGAQGRTGPEIDRAIEFVGGTLESGGGRDNAGLALSVFRKDPDLGLLADARVRRTFPPAELDRKREEVPASLRPSASRATMSWPSTRRPTGRRRRSWRSAAT